MEGWFVTGTDTGAGKTYVTCLLLRALRAAGLDAAGYKPVCCGDRDDARLLQAAGPPDLTLDAVNPLWLKSPVAPLAAARIENRPIDPAALLEGYDALAAGHRPVLVEGAGGWRVPLAPGYDMADLAADLALPVLVVVRNRLGALNHTLLTLESIRARGLECAGIVLNDVEAERDVASISNRVLMEESLSIRVLGEVLHDDTDLSFPFPP